MKRMNYIKILCFSAVITGLGSIVSCGDAKYDTLDTHAYIEEALSSTSQKVTVQATGESFTTLNVHLVIFLLQTIIINWLQINQYWTLITILMEPDI